MHSDDEFTSAFDNASGATMERFQNPLWFITDLFFGSKLRKDLATVKAFGREIVAKAVADRESGKQLGSAPALAENPLDQISGTLIQSFLDSIGDERIVADAALNYLSAGRYIQSPTA